MADINQIRAHNVIRNLADNLAMKGALPPEARAQMIDGFVSKANLLQAKQVMADAEANGDGQTYLKAAYLHKALGFAMEFQDAHDTRLEGRDDARETLLARHGPEAFGMDPGFESGRFGGAGYPAGYPGGYDTVPRRGAGVGEVLLTGALFAGAAVLMDRHRGRHSHHHGGYNRHHDGHNRHNNHRTVDVRVTHQREAQRPAQRRPDYRTENRQQDHRQQDQVRRQDVQRPHNDTSANRIRRRDP